MGDLLASLNPHPILDIQIGDRLYSIPPYPAATWIGILHPDTLDLWELVPGMIGEEGCEEHCGDLLISGEWSREDYEQLCLDVTGVAGGRYWWAVMRLLAQACDPTLGDWVRGQLVLHHIDANTLSFAAWLDAVYGVFTYGMGQDRIQKFDTLLNKPPASSKAKLDPKHKRANFAAAMAG